MMRYYLSETIFLQKWYFHFPRYCPIVRRVVLNLKTMTVQRNRIVLMFFDINRRDITFITKTFTIGMIIGIIIWRCTAAVLAKIHSHGKQHPVVFSLTLSPYPKLWIIYNCVKRILSCALYFYCVIRSLRPRITRWHNRL